jgi:hypothetical protein
MKHSPRSKINWNVFYKYKNAFTTKEAVIFGNGPTVNDYKIKKDVIHIGCNRSIYDKKLTLDFYFYNDFAGISKKYREDIYKYQTNIEKFFGTFPNARGVGAKTEDVHKGNCALYDMDGPVWTGHAFREYETDIAKHYMSDFGTSTVFVLMQFALYCGFKTIYIAGCDIANYSGAKTSDRYFYHADHLPKMPPHAANGMKRLYTKWKKMQDFIYNYYPDTRIISINPIGLKDLFETEEEAEEAEE